MMEIGGGGLPTVDDLDALMDAYRRGERALESAIKRADREERGWRNVPTAGILHERAAHVEDHLRSLDLALTAVAEGERTAADIDFDEHDQNVVDAQRLAADGAHTVNGGEDFGDGVVIGYLAVVDEFAPDELPEGMAVQPGTYALVCTERDGYQVLTAAYLLGDQGSAACDDPQLSTLRFFTSMAALPTVVSSPGVDAFGGKLFVCDGVDLHRAVTICDETGIPGMAFGITVRLPG